MIYIIIISSFSLFFSSTANCQFSSEIETTVDNISGSCSTCSSEYQQYPIRIPEMQGQGAVPNLDSVNKKKLIESTENTTLIPLVKDRSEMLL